MSRVTPARMLATLVGLAFVWSALGLAGVGLAGDPFRPGAITVTADFPRTVGLYPQSRVRVQGIDSGWVKKVEPGLHGVKVTMEVSGVALAEDATATMRLKSMIGERYVDLGPVWTGKGERLRSGDTIPRQRVHLPAEISDVLDQFTRLAEGVDKKALGDFIHQLAASVDGRQDDLAAMVANFADAGRVLSARAGDIDQSIVELQGMIGTLASKDDKIVDILHSSTAVSDALLAQNGALDASIDGIDKLTQQVSTFTVGQKEHLKTLLDSLDRVGQVLAKNEGNFNQVVDLLPIVAHQYQQAVDHDGDRWYTVNYPEGILFLPSAPPINGRGGPGSQRTDHTVVPELDHSGSPLGQAAPNQVDVTPITGDGPLLPGMTFGPKGGSVCDNPRCD